MSFGGRGRSSNSSFGGRGGPAATHTTTRSGVGRGTASNTAEPSASNMLADSEEEASSVSRSSAAESKSKATTTTAVTTAMIMPRPAASVVVASTSSPSSAAAVVDETKSTFYPASYFISGGDASLPRVYGGIPLPLNCVVEYWPAFISSAERDGLYSILLTSLKWEKTGMSRDTLLVGDSDVQYRYGRALESSTPAPWTHDLLILRDRIQRVLGCKMDICLCGWYADGKKKIGWHRDHEELGHHTPIASISLGAERLFEFKENKAKLPAASLILAHGSLLVMGEYSQDRYLHALNPDVKAKTGRINLTFRCSSGEIQTPTYSTSPEAQFSFMTTTATSSTTATASTTSSLTSSAATKSSIPSVAPSKTAAKKTTKSAAVIDDD